MGWKDNLEAQARGAAQTLTGGWNDELVARLIQAMPHPVDYGGIPREYAGGQYEQYRDEQRADEAESQRKAPGNFGFGQFAGGIPGAVATFATGGLPAVGLGVLGGGVSGAGQSTNTGAELAKDTARGAAIGGGLAAGGELAQAGLKAAAPAMKALWRGGPPPPLAPALATAGTAPVRAPAPPPRPTNLSVGGGSKPPSKKLDVEPEPQTKSLHPTTQEVTPSPSSASVKPMDEQRRAREQLAFDLPGPQQGPRPGKWYATDDPAAPLSGPGESSSDVFAVPGFTDKKYVVKTGPQGEVSRIFTTDDTGGPIPGLPEPRWLTNFGKIPYDDEAIAALRENMPREGQGGTRLAVGFTNEEGNPYVRKIATNESGRRANAFEADMSGSDGVFENKPGTRPLADEARKIPKPTLTAPVFRGEGNKYLEMPKLRRVTDKDLVQHFGLDRRFSDVMSDWLNHGKRLPPGNPKWDAFQAQLDQLREVMPGIGDIEHPRQWGFDADGELKLLDYGYNVTPTKTPKATRPAIQRELPYTDKRYNYHAVAPHNIPGIAATGLDPNKSGANFPWAGKRPQTFFAPREEANKARELIAGREGVESRDIRMLRTSRGAKPWTAKSGDLDTMYTRSSLTAADDIEILNKKGKWVNIREVLPKGQPPSPPAGLDRQQLLKWWGSILGMAGISNLRMKSDNQDPLSER